MKFRDLFIEIRFPKPWEGDISLGLFTVDAIGVNEKAYKSFNIGLLLLEIGFYRAA